MALILKKIWPPETPVEFGGFSGHSALVQNQALRYLRAHVSVIKVKPLGKRLRFDPEESMWTVC